MERAEKVNLVLNRERRQPEDSQKGSGWEGGASPMFQEATLVTTARRATLYNED